uniref:Myb/SANT-like domain-containing protein n=1 Tax=Triticum urartu TaxID=4572 RepID=A0A8R7UED3_TRIUA
MVRRNHHPKLKRHLQELKSQELNGTQLWKRVWWRYFRSTTLRTIGDRMEKQKDLKAQYRLIKDARKQSGVNWNYHTHMIDADVHLWQNLMTTLPEIAKFQNKPFPLYNKLGDLYDGHIAEGNFNFTSTEVTQVSAGDPKVEREQIAFSFDLNQYGDDLHMYDDPRDVAPSDGSRDAAPSGGSRDASPSDGPRDAAQTGARWFK